MIGRSILLVIGAGVAFGAVVIAVLSAGLGVPNGLWALVPAAIGAVVAVFEWVRINRTPLDGARPGIVPGDE